VAGKARRREPPGLCKGTRSLTNDRFDATLRLRMTETDEQRPTPPPPDEPRPTPPIHADRVAPATGSAVFSAPSAGRVEGGALPIDYNVRSADVAGPATDHAYAAESPAAPPLTIKTGSDFLPVDAAERQAQVASIPLRPVEAMLRDPLGEVARKERRSLLGISAVAILVGRTGLVPARIENFGITFATPERQALLWVFVAVVIYYSAAFIIYSISDALGWGYAVYRGREELRKQIEEDSRNVMTALRGQQQAAASPWRFVVLVTPVSLTRGLFDFVVPLLVAGYAIWSLWGAVHQVVPKESVTPAASSAPNLRAR
jgi:hypothetical protein